MAAEINYFVKEVDGKYFDDLLLVTISLEEYRSLIQENLHYEAKIEDLENRLRELRKNKSKKRG